MLTLSKIAALSAVLTAGLASVSETPVSAASSTSAKIFVDRVTDVLGSIQQVRFADAARAAPVVNRAGKGDAVATPVECALQAWPYKSADCLSSAEGVPARRSVRTIAINTAR